jgi:hypothetical protein
MPLIYVSNSFLICRKRKPRKNVTKGWFPKEASTSMPEQHNPTPNEHDDAPFKETGCSFPPRDKQVALKKLTPKKNISRK